MSTQQDVGEEQRQHDDNNTLQTHDKSEVSPSHNVLGVHTWEEQPNDKGDDATTGANTIQEKAKNVGKSDSQEPPVVVDENKQAKGNVSKLTKMFQSKEEPREVKSEKLKSSVSEHQMGKRRSTNPMLSSQRGMTAASSLPITVSKDSSEPGESYVYGHRLGRQLSYQLFPCFCLGNVYKSLFLV